MYDQIQLINYSKHIPKVLRQQILCELMKKYAASPLERYNEIKASTDADGESEEKSSVEAKREATNSGPSFQRFYGALLFVDISGFTVLAQKLDIESLKNHINSYFSLMLDVIDKWEGDVAKFAGDALYIVWPINVYSSLTSDTTRSTTTGASSPQDTPRSTTTAFSAAMKKAIEQAAHCGLEISSVCGNYEVRLVDQTSSPGSILGKFLPFAGFGSKRVVPTSTGEDVVFLNVHSGISAGLMGGIDVICQNRAEFFLVGDPLTGVAMAESQASKGDVVLCTYAHSVFHEDGKAEQCGADDQSSNRDNILFCGCTRTPNGLFRVSKLLARGIKDEALSPMRRNRSRSKLKTENETIRGDVNEQNSKLLKQIQGDIDRLILTVQPGLKREFFAFLKRMHEIAEDGNIDISTAKSDERKFAMFMKEFVTKHFIEWMNYSLLENVVRHVHEVERTMFDFSATHQNLSSFHDVLRQSTAVLTSMHQEHHSSTDITSASTQGPMGSSDLDEEMELEERRKHMPKSETQSYCADLNNGELRTVIVMFIKIDKFDLRLKTDNECQDIKFSYKRFPFLARTENEEQADEFLLSRFQSCFNVLCKAFTDHGGQLRQFIVDDKGTVCIGTFGLRGSAAVDNAAAALEAAKVITDGLIQINLTSFIGITSGKAYCGLVGSTARHEYAVMGPSTNLSARLMSKAPPHGVICDADTMERDRAHKFDTLSEIQAKGYVNPVMTYSPVFEGDDTDTYTLKTFAVSPSLNRLLKGHSGSGSASGQHSIFAKSTTRLGKEAMEIVLTAKSSQQLKLTAAQRVMAMAKTDFFVHDNKTRFDIASNQQSVTHKLCGRQEEIIAIFTFLLENDPTNPQYLHTDGKAKTIAICSSSGMGKSTLLNALERKLQYMIRADGKMALIIVRNRSTAFRLASEGPPPLSPWRNLLCKILNSLYKSCTKMNSAPSSTREISSQRRTSEEDVDFSAALIDFVMNQIWPLVEESWKEQFDLVKLLLGADNFDSGIDENTIGKCCRLLAPLFSAIAAFMKKLILFMMDDIESMDKWSQTALYEICNESSGVAVIVSLNMIESAVTSPRLMECELPYNAESNNTGLESKAFFCSVVDYDRLKAVTLKPLDKVSTFTMVSETFPNINNAEVEKIYEASGGRPLYIAELAKSIAKAMSNANNKSKSMLHIVGEVITEATPGTLQSNYRIEETIYHRLDRLSIPSQVVLKAIAVIVSYGRGCTLEVLSFVLSNSGFFLDDPAVTPSSSYSSNSSNSGKGAANISSALLKLFHQEDFLRLSNATIHHRDLTLGQLPDVTIEFHIPLEQTTIYALIVDEQKEFFHERVALYLHFRTRSIELRDADLKDLWEEGYHWENAVYPSRALRAYLLAAKKCKIDKDCIGGTESILMAYQVYQNMEQEFNIISLPEQCFGYADMIAQCLFKPTLEHLRELETSADLIIALKTAQEVFEPDPPAIIDAIELHILLAEMHLYKWEEFEEVTRVLSVGILLCAAAIWKPTGSVRRSSRSTGNDHFSHRSSNGKRASKYSISQANEYMAPTKRMTKYDYLQLFSLCAYTARFVSLEMSFTISFEHSKTLLIQDDGNEFDGHRDFDDSKLIAIHTETMMALRYLQLGKPNRAASLLDQALELYTADKSDALADRYSADFVPYAMALLSQALLASRDIQGGFSYWQKAVICLQSVNHDYSLTIALMTLMSSIHFVGDYDSILSLLKKNQDLSCQGYNTMGSHITRMLSIWMQMKGGKCLGDVPVLTDECISLWNTFANLISSAANPSSAKNIPIEESTKSSNGKFSSQFEITMSKLYFLELHGCALERIYVEVICGLWHGVSKAQVTVLEQKIKGSLQILLQCPIYDFMSIVSKGYNMIHSLTHVLLTGDSENGLSAGAIFAAVTERAEQPLLTLLRVLLQKECAYMTWLLAAVVQTLPLHDTIQESYKQICYEAAEKVQRMYSHDQSLEKLIRLAKVVGVKSNLAIPSQ